MIHFIRDKHNNTIVDCETLPDDLHVFIDIWNYSAFLLAAEGDKTELVQDFDDISDLRGMWFESGAKDKYNEPWEFAREILKEYADKYGLWYVED